MMDLLKGELPFFSNVNTDSSILYGTFGSFFWLRCNGRGSFANSPVLKRIADQYIDDGGRMIVIDLENCPGVDSTFMGALAGLARRLMPMGGSVQIASPTERARAAMESLGLDALLEIEPPVAPWRGKTEDIRARLSQEESHHDDSLADLDRARHVLDSHLTLSKLSEANAEKFHNVTECLKKEIQDKENKNR